MELLEAASKGDTILVEQLVSAGANVDVKDYKRQTPLIRAARSGHLDVVRFLVEHGAAVDASGRYGKTPIMRAAGGGYLDVVRFLVEHGAAVDASDSDGQTPIMRAARGGNLDMVRFLVEHGAAVDASDSDGWTLLMLAAGGGHLDMVRFLVEHGAAVDASDSDGQTPLMLAAGGGNLDMVRFLVEHGAAVDASDSDGWTLLMLAARGGKLDVVRFLVEHGAAVDASDRYGKTPIMLAAVRDFWDVVRFLVEHGAAVDASDSDGQTPIMRAAGGGNLDMVRFLVEHGAAVDASDSDGWTLLMLAARGGNLDVVRFLVEHGAAVDASDRYGKTPIMLAAVRDFWDVVRFLVEHGAAVDASDSDGWTLLMLAARGGKLDVVRFLVEHGAAVDASGRYGKTPIMLAAGGGYLDVVRFLVEHGAAVDASDSDGQTPIMLAARGGHLDMVRFLVEHGAAVDASDKYGQTPIMLAAGGGHLDMVRFLVEHGAAVDASGRYGKTPIMLAAGGGHLDMVRFLVEHGAAVDASDSDGQTPIMLAARGGNLDMVRFLVEHGAAVDVSDSDGWTLLMRAANGGDLDMIRILVEHGAAVDASDSDGQTPIMRAARSGHLNVVRFLVEHGAAVDAGDSDGWTLLMRAANGGDLDMIRILVEGGAAVDARNSDGWTLLMRAASGGHLDIVRILVEGSAAVDACDNAGETPLMKAADNGHLNVVQYLVKHRANVNLMSSTGNTALSSATRCGRQEIVQFLFPFVQSRDRRTQTENHDQHAARSSNIPSSWLISPFEIEVEPFVNDGNIGGDYLGKWLDADVVVKLFVDNATSASFIDVVRLWHQLRHPNVLKLYGVCNTGHYFFVCEYASNGSLPQYLKSCDVENRTPWKFLLEAALGLEYLHERKIVHGNLCGNNILIGSDRLAKLSRFGLSASSSGGRWRTSGALVRWMAPESLKGGPVSLASDVYSFSMCILEAVTGKVPYDGRLESTVKLAMKYEGNGMIYLNDQLKPLLDEQRELVLAMCRDEPRERLQMPAVVNKLELFAETEAAKLTQHTAQPEPDLLVAFDEFDCGKMRSLWKEVQSMVDKSENDFYHQLWHEMELIYDAMNAEKYLWSTLQRFHDLLSECRFAIDSISHQTYVHRMSATRARDHSIQGLHRRIIQLLQLVRPQDQDAETRETEWKRLCREQIEIFVSEASEACVMLSSVDSEEDRSALVAVLRAELRNTDRKYTDKQLAVLQKTYDEIVFKSLEDSRLATTPEWFIPWFELEMNEMTMLGEGGFGSVIKAKWLDSEVVVKKLEIADKDAANADKKREMRQMFEREVDIWFGLSHPHVVRLFGACHVGRPFFVCELAPNGTLVEYLRHHPDELWLKLREAALGVQYLHARGIVHGDLKGNNILIGSDGKAKVTDFGLSGVFGDDLTVVILSGAYHWVAPECLIKQKPTFASDIYSLGMCIIEALRVTNGDEDYLPWGDLPNPAVKFHVTKNHRLPSRPKNCSDEAWILIERMCKSEPTDRILIMTVVDELEKLSCGVDQIVNNIDTMQLSSSSVTDTLAEMKIWLANCDPKAGDERDVLKKIHKLLWDRLEHVATQLDEITTNSDFSKVVESSRVRTHEALSATGVIPLIKFTELALRGYALHRRLDKFMAAHAVPRDSSPLHDWTSTCSTFMGVSASPTPACIEEDCSANEETGGCTRIASATEVAAAS